MYRLFYILLVQFILFSWTAKANIADESMNIQHQEGYDEDSMDVLKEYREEKEERNPD